MFSTKQSRSVRKPVFDRVGIATSRECSLLAMTAFYLSSRNPRSSFPSFTGGHQ